MRKLITVITPTFNEEDNVEVCYQTILQLFQNELKDYDFEYIFADNASQDRTPERLRTLAEADSRVKVIYNARNYGPLRSNFNALTRATGDAVLVCLAADLQDPPELLPDFVRKWEEGNQVVYGVRLNRPEPVILRNLRKIFYRIINRLAEVPIPVDAGEYQLIDRAVLNALLVCDDYYPYIRGLIANCGFKSTGIAYDWKRRRSGLSKATWFGLIDQAINALISFSNIPIRICLLGGLALATISTFYSIAQLLSVLVLPKGAASGIPTIVVALFFFGGVQLFFLGIIGEYVTAIHAQVRRRPLVVERAVVNFETGPRVTPTSRP